MFLDLLKNFFFLFAVIDPLGAIPIFLSATKNFDNKNKKLIALKAPAIACLILIFFILVGQFIMDTMHITLPAFRVSGGIVLFIFALTMVFGHEKEKESKEMMQDPSHVTIFPIAMPAIASPGAILAVVLLTDNSVYSFSQQLTTIGIVVMVMIATGLLLLAAGAIQKKLGEAFILVFTKIMGLILASFAVESILGGIKEYFSL